jgi:hypothetical protein
MANDDRKNLQKAMARLAAHRKQLHTARGQLKGRAAEQLDTMPHAIQTANDYVAKEKGGVLTYRYLKTRITEGARLRAIDTHTGDDGD